MIVETASHDQGVAVSGQTWDVGLYAVSAAKSVMPTTSSSFPGCLQPVGPKDFQSSSTMNLIAQSSSTMCCNQIIFACLSKGHKWLPLMAVQIKCPVVKVCQPLTISSVTLLSLLP